MEGAALYHSLIGPLSSPEGSGERGEGSREWTVGSGQWVVGKVDSGEWTVGRGQWGSGQWGVVLTAPISSHGSSQLLCESKRETRSTTFSC